MRGLSVFITFWLVSTAALAKVSCERAANLLIRHVAESYPVDGVLKTSHRDAIQKIWDDATVSREEKLHQTFQIFVEARLETLELKVRERVEKVIEDSVALGWREPSETPDNFIRSVAMYLPEEKRVAVGVYFAHFPLEMKLVSIVHELEHAIQMASGREDLIALRGDSRAVFFMEASAMSSEWELAREIRDLSSVLKNFLSENEQRIPKIGAMALLLVNEAPKHDSARNYLRTQWEHGRYTLKNSGRVATAFIESE